MADYFSSCPVVQLLAINVQNIGT